MPLSLKVLDRAERLREMEFNVLPAMLQLTYLVSPLSLSLSLFLNIELLTLPPFVRVDAVFV